MLIVICLYSVLLWIAESTFNLLMFILLDFYFPFKIRPCVKFTIEHTQRLLQPVKQSDEKRCWGGGVAGGTAVLSPTHKHAQAHSMHTQTNKHGHTVTLTPLAAAICTMTLMAVWLKKRPSPPTTTVEPWRSRRSMEEKILWMKLCR